MKYDEIGRTYAQTRATDPRIAAAIWEALGDARTVVNVGAGTGNYEPPDRDVTAVEPSAVMIAQRPPGAAPCVQAGAEDLPFEDRAFDRVWSQDAFLHSGDRNRVLEEARRVLRGGGRLVFTDPMAADGVRRDLLSPILRRLQLDSMASPSYYRSQLTRLGARVLLYGPLNVVLHPHVVQTWIGELAGFTPGNDSERLGWAFCLAQLARRSGQRPLDVDDAHRDRVLAILRGQKVPEHWLRMVEEFSELEGDEQSQMFGESLPIGLRLLHPVEPS